MLDIFDERPEHIKVDSVCLAIRDKDKNMKRRNKLDQKRLTYWDAEDLALRFPRVVFPLNNSRVLPEGTIWIGSDHRPERSGGICVTASELVELQFATTDLFSAIKIVADEIGVEGIVSEADAIEEMRRYCTTMDEAIVSAAKALKQHKVKDIFEKMSQVLVGKEPKPEDKLGRRVIFYRDLVLKYREDKEKYRPELKRLGVL